MRDGGNLMKKKMQCGTVGKNTRESSTGRHGGAEVITATQHTAKDPPVETKQFSTVPYVSVSHVMGKKILICISKYKIFVYIF